MNQNLLSDAYQFGRNAYKNNIESIQQDALFLDFLNGNTLTTHETWLLKKQWIKAYSDASIEDMNELHARVFDKYL